MDESKEKRIADTLNQLKKDRFVSNLSPNDQLGIVDYFEDFFCSDGCGDDHSGNAIIAFMHALISQEKKCNLQPLYFAKTL